MKIQFYKYQGTGNDFIMIDNRLNNFPKNNSIIEKLCDRRFGIGADGLILLEKDSETDFRMVYYNADGNESSMCGNGGRCIVAFAKKLNLIENKTSFIATDGLHHAEIDANEHVSLQMKNVSDIKIADDYVFLNTGSPHHVTLVNDIDTLAVKTIGAEIRYSNLYGKSGCNINFVIQIADNEFSIRTYERGVEDETLSCGTGATAVAISMYAIGKSKSLSQIIHVQGGKLEITFQEKEGFFEHVLLKGPATFVFEAQIEL